MTKTNVYLSFDGRSPPEGTGLHLRWNGVARHGPITETSSITETSLRMGYYSHTLTPNSKIV